MKLSYLSALQILAASSVAAQAPRITPAGDPSVRADTIYRLAVDPARYPEESVAYLLDDGVVRFEKDGRGTTTFRTIVQILKAEAAESFRERRFSYAPGHERLTVNWVRVVRPNGQIVSARPPHVQDSDVPAEFGDPVYSDRKVRQMELSGVEAGTVVDISYTREELRPFLPGDFLQSWSVANAGRTLRSRFLVDVPAGFPLRIEERNLSFRRAERTAHGRTVYAWTTADVPRWKGELFAADSNDVTMTVAVASPTTWADIGRWYAGNARDRYAITPPVAAKLSAVVQGARTLDDSIRAVHKWVAQDIRYVALALGMGGFRPRTPDSVVTTGYGDCKDKATLFVAALGRLGVTAFPVLLNSEGNVRRGLPSIDQFDHAIAAVRRPDGGYQYVDLTAEFVPYGELPPGYQGEFGIVVHPDGAVEEITFPRAEASGNRAVTTLAGTLSPDGLFEGHFEKHVTGTLQYSLRSAFEHAPDSTQKANFARQVARAHFPNADGDSLEYFDGKNFAVPARIAFRVHHGRAARQSGATTILTLPFGAMGRLVAAADELLTEPRRFPVDAEKVIGAQTSVDEFRVTLPEGWHAQLPPSVAASSAFGSYAAEYAQAGRELRFTRTLSGARGIYPRDRVRELAEWLRAVGQDDATFVVLEHGATGAPAGSGR